METLALICNKSDQAYYLKITTGKIYVINQSNVKILVILRIQNASAI